MDEDRKKREWGKRKSSERDRKRKDSGTKRFSDRAFLRDTNKSNLVPCPKMVGKGQGKG